MIGATFQKTLSEVRREMAVLPDDRAVDAIVGYRSWWSDVDLGAVRLTSVTRRDTVWYPKTVLQAQCVCRRSIQTAGGGEPGHRCGIYAWRTAIYPVTPLSLGHAARVSGLQVVIGEVAMWGKIHVHARGYRAEYALPIAFYVAEGMAVGLRRRVELASLEWGVPVVLVDSWPHTILGRR